MQLRGRCRRSGDNFNDDEPGIPGPFQLLAQFGVNFRGSLKHVSVIGHQARPGGHRQRGDRIGELPGDFQRRHPVGDDAVPVRVIDIHAPFVVAVEVGIMPDKDRAHFGEVDHGRFFRFRLRLLEATADVGHIFATDPIAAIVGHVLGAGRHHDSPDPQAKGVDIHIQAVGVTVPGAKRLAAAQVAQSTDRGVDRRQIGRFIQDPLVDPVAGGQVHRPANRRRAQHRQSNDQ